MDHVLEPEGNRDREQGIRERQRPNGVGGDPNDRGRGKSRTCRCCLLFFLLFIALFRFQAR